MQLGWNFNNRTLESCELLYSVVCSVLEQEIEPWNNSVTQSSMVMSVVLWTRIEYIYSIMDKVDAVYTEVIILEYRQ